MTSTETPDATAQFELALAALQSGEYGLTLFVSGASASSANAIANVREICDRYLSGRHQLNIVDLNQEPALAREHDVLATPTLVVDRPPPMRMLVGDMSDHVRILVALDVRSEPELEATPAAAARGARS